MPSRRELAPQLVPAGWARSVCEGGGLCPWQSSSHEGPSPESAPCFPQISFFSLLSVLCVMLSMAGSVLSCKNAQLARDFQQCSLVRSEEGELERTGLGRCAGHLSLS